MTIRTRKFVGTLLMLAFVFAYALIVTALAAPVLASANKVVEGIFYLVAGLAWAPPLMLLIRWMEGRKSTEG